MEQTVQSSSHQSEHHFLRILLAAHITQIALFSTSDSIDSHQIDEKVITLSSISLEESENLASLINQLRGKADLPDLQTDIEKLYSYVCSVKIRFSHTTLIRFQCLMPFMRCVIIFRQYLDLYNIDYLPAEVLESKKCSFKAICQVLDLSPSLCSFFDADGS